MKKLLFLAVPLLVIGGVITGLYLNPDVTAGFKERTRGDQPDLPDFARFKVDKEAFMQQRADNIAMLRGISKDEPTNPRLRVEAIDILEQQEARRDKDFAGNVANWTELGPNPIPNGQVGTGAQLPVSGRTIAIAVHPTNPDIVYVGTAQGGLYRSVNGGTSWTTMMDNAASLAIGAIAIAPSQPDTIYVGTGEANFSSDSFFGVGVYRIDNASTASPIITGPLNDDVANADIFTGRGVGEILVHPTNPAIIFVASNSGVGGLVSTANNILPSRGIYRSTDATSADPTFTKLTGLAANANASVRDIAFDPLNPNLLVANVVAAGGVGGIYTSANALSAAPTFTQTSIFNSSSTSELTAEFAVQHTVGNPQPTFYAATGNLGGRILTSIDGGMTWTQQIDNNFCTPQCFYDIAIDVDPNNAANLYVGGAPALAFGRSINNGTTFTTNAQTASGLHVDSHAIAVAPSNPAIVYFGSDGGIYRTNDATATPIAWTSLNNTTFRATQFMGLAVHPVNANFTIGGTQDNGTNIFQPAGTWFRADFGDGGYAVIDQNSPDTTNVRMYHTYFNQTNAMGYARVTTASSGTEGNWNFFGCGFAGTPNGMTCAATAILFYAPMEQGPGSPFNTLYFGSDVLYRSADGGTTMTKVSQEPLASGIPISAIGIAPQNDNVRIVGQSNGNLFGTTTGATTLTNLDPANNVPAAAVTRAAIDPNNADIAYVGLSSFGINTLYKTINLSSPTPAWTAVAGTGGNIMPQVPVNGLVIDPQNSNRVYAGTDIGVYVSTDGGANWIPYGTGLPRVAVFDITLTSERLLRIATHGRGLWQIPAISDAPGNVSISGRVVSPGGAAVSRAIVTITDPQGVTRTAVTNSFGNYQFDGITTGKTYNIQISAKGYQFQTRNVSVGAALQNLDFTAIGEV